MRRSTPDIRHARQLYRRALLLLALVPVLAALGGVGGSFLGLWLLMRAY